MKKLLLIFLLIPVLASSQWLEMGKQKIGNKVGIQSSGAYQWALDFDGSTEYLSCTPALRLTGEYSLVDNFSDGDYNGWTVSSGAYSVVDSVPLSGGTKSLKCTTAGIISIPCNQVYGQWEFDLYKGADGNRIDISFIKDNSSNIATGSGYYFTFHNNESGTLTRLTSGGGSDMLQTATSYITNNTWYSCKITRNTNGQFYLYIKGGTFGSTYTLISVSGGSGSNPVTNNANTLSNFFVLDLDANDMIANIVCQQGEGSLDLNSYERIYHSNNRAFEDTTGFRWAGNGTHSIVRNTDATTGSNLVPDSASTFSTSGVGYWTLKACCTLNWNSADSSMLIIANATTGRMYFGRSILTTGNPYKITFRAKSVNHATGWTIDNLINASIAVSNPNMTSNWQNYEFHVLAGTGIPRISVYPTTQDIGDSVYIDNIIIEKLESRTGYSGKLISTDVGDSTTNYISLPAVNFDTLKTDANGVYEKYTLELWCKSKGSSGLPRVNIRIGNQLKISDTISNIAFEKVVFNFQSNALVSNQPILLYLNQADTVYLDDVSLTKSYDYLFGAFVNPIDNNAVAGIFDYGTSFNNSMANNLNTFLSRFGNASSDNRIQVQSNGFIYNKYSLVHTLANRTLNLAAGFNGGNSNSTSMSSTDKMNLAGDIIKIGLYVSSSYFKGTIGHLQFTKFTDISQSNVNSTTLTTAYNRGKLIQNEWTGGSPVEVAFYDWKGADATEMLRDKSGTGNNLTGTNMDINDRVKVKSKFK